MVEESENPSFLQSKRNVIAEKRRVLDEKRALEEAQRAPKKKKEITDLLTNSSMPVRIEVFTDMATRDILFDEIGDDDEKWEARKDEMEEIESRIDKRRSESKEYSAEWARFESLLGDLRNIHTSFSSETISENYDATTRFLRDTLTGISTQALPSKK